MSEGWQWLNHHHLTRALDRIEDPETHELVLEALESLLAAPYEPENLDFHRMHGSPIHLERWIAWLPGGWYVTYRPYIAGPPPHVGNHVVVLAMRHLSDVD